MRGPAPTLTLERGYWQAGAELVAGIDEVGRGAWAGPLSVGVAVIPSDRRIYGIRDSKLLTERQREEMFERVAGWCIDWAVGHATAEECDRLGMSEAQRVAAGRALEGLVAQPDVVLIDGKWDFVNRGRTRTIVHGDRVSVAIAAASILAKVAPRSSDPRHVRGSSVVRLHQQQGLPEPEPQGRTPRLGAVGATPDVVGVHGQARVVRGGTLVAWRSDFRSSPARSIRRMHNA